MQGGVISSIEFHKALQEVEKYRKRKTDIRNQSKTKMKQITKEHQEELLQPGNKEDKEDYFMPNCKCFRYPGCQCQLKYEAPIPKSWLRTYLYNKYNQIQNLTLHLFSCLLSCHRSLINFSRYYPSWLSYCVLQDLSFLHSLVNYLLLLKFIQAFCTYGGIISKYDIFIRALCLDDCFFKLLFCFHTVSIWYIQFFCFL